MSESDVLVLVDAEDREIGFAPKLQAHVEGLRHRAISVLLFDNRGRALLQKRASSKYHCGGLWSNTCCGHPRPGEHPLLSAARRLREEMGIETALHSAGQVAYRTTLPNGLIEDEIVHLFAGRFNGEPRPNADEVEDWDFVTPARLGVDVSREPTAYTYWFRLYLSSIPKLFAPHRPPRAND